MQAHLAAVGLLDVVGPEDVIEVRVGVDDRAHDQIVGAHDRCDALELAAGIDHDRLAGRGIGQDRAVATQRPGRERLAQHPRTIARRRR
jgi:hypothetical protein